MPSNGLRPQGRHGLAHHACACLAWLILLLLSGWASHAHAHAALVGSVPAAQAVQDTAPEQVVLRFNEPVSPLTFRLIDPRGGIVPVPNATAAGNDVHVRLPSIQAHGTYGLSWRVVSADGHPVGGTFAFSVGSASRAGPQDGHASTATPLRQALIWLTRLLIYLGVFFGIAAAVYTGAGAGRLRKQAATLVVAGALAVLSSLPLLGLDALDQAWTAIFGKTVWRAAIATSYVRTAILLLLACMVALEAWRCRSPRTRSGLAIAALALAAGGLAASGHASAAPPEWLSRPAVWLHALAAALWLGVFWPLLRELSTPSRHLVALPRFTRLAPAVVALLLLSGATLAWIQLDDWTALWRTAYGRLLSAKLVLVGVLLALGAWNRYRLTRPVHNGGEAARGSMRRIVAAELLLAIAVLCVVAAWRFTPPPRALHAPATASRAQPALLTIRTASATAEVNWRSGPARAPEPLVIVLSAPNRSSLPAKEVRVIFSNPAAGIEPLVFAATRTPDASWRVELAALPPLTGWQLRIDALVSDFDRITLEAPWPGSK